MRELKQNVAASAMLYFASAGEHITGVTGINSVNASASKNGAAFASISFTASAERARGWYNFTLNTGFVDTLGDLVFTISAASSDPVEAKFNVVANVEADSYNELVNGTYGLSFNYNKASGSYAEVTHASYGLAKLVRSATAANLLQVATGGEVNVIANLDKTGYTVAAGGIPVGGFAAGAITDAAVAADAENAIAAANWAKVIEAAGSITAAQAMSVLLSVLAGVTTASGATFKTPDGTATRVAATVDANNQRTAMTLTPSA